ncbi:hypothetical protein [Jeotgalibaca caeni]|uniref:hypothetical protein n=1 Tax=Jeotgalibaca caeni TaxID=3028623 RepID=UPI00237DE278|nr:hypothetical protein [Jeotgalibaca caeni]MDE1549489.1 hypothetical protein [Jeotgalibaca caeni]
MGNRIIDTDAQASALGWDFQSSLALFYIIDDIKKLEKVKVEGKTEDIELEYHTGEKIYIQAKSQLDPFSNSNADKHLRNALKALINTSQKCEYTHLIYGTNISNPFVYKGFNQLFSGYPTNYSFNELPNKIKEKIEKNIIKVASEEKLSLELFNYDKLRIITLPFFGDHDDTRYRFVKEKVFVFLSKIGLNMVEANRIYKVFLLDFTKNASKSIHIDKEDLAWTIIVCALDTSDDEFFDEFDLDIGQQDEIERRYEGFIDRKTLDFSLLNEVEQHFKEMHLKKCFTINRTAPKEFINRTVDYYEKKIFFKESNDLTKDVTKFIIWKILKKRKLILRLSKEVGL